MGCGTGDPIEYSWENVIPPWQQMVAQPLGEWTQRQLGELATPLPSDMPVAAPISDPMMAAGNILMNEYLGMPFGGGMGGYGGGMGGYGGGLGTKGPRGTGMLQDQMGPISPNPPDPGMVFQQSPMQGGPMPMPGYGPNLGMGMGNPYAGMGNPYSPYFIPPQYPFSY